MLLDGHVELDRERYELRLGGERISLEPRAFDVLVHLVLHRDRVVSKEELMDAVWQDRFVSEAAVTSRIKEVRRALGDDGHAQRVIRTVHGRGYRFVADVRERTDGPGRPEVGPGRLDAGAVTAAPPRGPIRYTTSDGLHVAYQVSGRSGPAGAGETVDLVLIPGFISHLDLDWEDPRHAVFLDGLGEMGRLVRFDKRGTGMSDRPVGVPDLETRMHDVLAVMDAVESRRAVLFGYSEGGPMALLCAAMHPSRVRALVLYGSYACRVRREGYPWAPTAAEQRSKAAHLMAAWDWEHDLLMRCPSGDRAMQEWWARRMRASATPSTVEALMAMNALVDVRSLLGSVRVPTLVLHRTGDALLPPEHGRYLADHVPGARLVLLEGRDHLPCGDPGQILDAARPFVAGLPDHAQRTGLRVVAALRGRDAAAALASMRQAGGTARTTDRGEALVVFDGPAGAVRACHAAVGGLADARAALALVEVTLDDQPVPEPVLAPVLDAVSRAPDGAVVGVHPVGVLLAGTGVWVEPVPGSEDVLVTAVSDSRGSAR